MSKSIAALFVQRNGIYYGHDDIDPWDEKRDARKYNGPYPVIAHPPCQRWGNFAVSAYGIRIVGAMLGNDHGCFESAVNSVNQWGGVIEHPAYSKAFARYGLGKPNPKEGWIRSANGKGYINGVDQGHYGHKARKPTWLYVVGTDRLPFLPFWPSNPAGNIGHDHFAHMTHRYREVTPWLFFDLLVSIAKRVKRVSCDESDILPSGETRISETSHIEAGLQLR